MGHRSSRHKSKQNLNYMSRRYTTPTHTDGRPSSYEEHKSKFRLIIIWMISKLQKFDKWLYNRTWWY